MFLPSFTRISELVRSLNKANAQNKYKETQPSLVLWKAERKVKMKYLCTRGTQNIWAEHRKEATQQWAKWQITNHHECIITVPKKAYFIQQQRQHIQLLRLEILIASLLESDNAASNLRRLHDSEYKGITILWNISNCSFNYTASHSRTLESSTLSQFHRL